jgi:hypothetical protein
MYTARTRSGFTPAVREHLHQRFRGLEVSACPFANLPKAARRAMGRRLDGCEDEELPVVEADPGGAV